MQTNTMSQNESIVMSGPPTPQSQSTERWPSVADQERQLQLQVFPEDSISNLDKSRKGWGAAIRKEKEALDKSGVFGLPISQDDIPSGSNFQTIQTVSSPNPADLRMVPQDLPSVQCLVDRNGKNTYALVICWVLVGDEYRVVIAKRPSDKIYPNFYEVPGGKQELHESSLAAALRELREEVGIDIPIEQANAEMIHEFTYSGQREADQPAWFFVWSVLAPLTQFRRLWKASLLLVS